MNILNYVLNRIKLQKIDINFKINISLSILSGLFIIFFSSLTYSYFNSIDKMKESFREKVIETELTLLKNDTYSSYNTLINLTYLQNKSVAEIKDILYEYMHNKYPNSEIKIFENDQLNEFQNTFSYFYNTNDDISIIHTIYFERYKIIKVKNVNMNETFNENNISISSMKNNLLTTILVSILFLTIIIYLTLKVKYLINKQTKESEKLIFDLEINTLTKLYNQQKLVIYLNENQNLKFNALLLDILSFNTINELYGFSIGDKVLINVSKLLKSEIKKQGLKSVQLYHLSSDRFLLLETVNDKKYKGDLISFFDNIENSSLYIEDISEHIFINFIGAYVINCNNTNLLYNVHKGLYQIKNNNENFIHFDYEKENSMQLFKDFCWKNKIHDGIKNDLFVPFIQPIYDVDKNIHKYEILMRFKELNNGVIEYKTPYFFLDVAKKYKLYKELNKIIIIKAFNIFKDLDYKFSINLSYIDLSSNKFTNFILNEIKKFPRKENITIEILESENIEDIEKAKSIINKFKELGCLISIDDFGSGFSNYTLIKNIMPNYIKIDGELIKNIDVDTNYKIVKHINLLAKDLNIKVIAEFVENKEIFDKLKALNIDFYQGYYLSRPFDLNTLNNDNIVSI